MTGRVIQSESTSDQINSDHRLHKASRWEIRPPCPCSEVLLYRSEDLFRLPQHTAVVILRPLFLVATVSVEIVLAVHKGNYSEFALVL